MDTPEDQLAGFLARFDPVIAALGMAAIDRLATRYPGALRMVYDNYNALVIGFSATPRPSDAVLSIALFPKWVTLCFLKGVNLPDPAGLLAGSGNQVRHRRLPDVAELDRPDIVALLDAAWATMPPPASGGALIIRSISAKQRPRRPT